MKVLHVINSMQTGGAEKLLLETIPFYNEKGVEADLLVLNGNNFPFLKILKSMQCCKIYSLGSMVYNPFHVFRLMPFLRKYEVVHVHLFPAQYWVVLAKILSFSNIKLVVTEHSTTNPRIKNFLLRGLDRFIYKFYDKVVCITDEVYQIADQHLKKPKSKLITIQNGVKLESIYNAQPYDRKIISKLIAEQDFLLIQTASFNKHKDQETLIKAAQFLPEKVKIIFVGDGIYREKCESLAEKLNLKERIIFLGNRTDVPQLLKIADVSILSTKGEGLSLTAIESMASGIPFIASNVTGMSFVKGAGLLFESENAEELALIVKNLMNDTIFYENTVNLCIQRAQQFDMKFMIDKHMALYNEIVKRER